ncbi:maltase A3-like [Belonocnema kinseyi]|uniref:maltase A3-like n=1 Tax=Belonocnema kinseyi TaxID=2817044 RepID=UPI00143DE970|nr:maltase A3-like [Belonocnema kinseyi]
MMISNRILLFVGVLAQLSENNIAEKLEEKEWWKTALVYQIWPRAFQDSDGDGEGDLQGIIQRLDYIKDIGVDAIWINPIYKSPLVDSGYDITDHNSIHPLFGNDNDIDALIEEAHERDLKVILDIVPNHSSIEHLWFNLSRAEVDPYDDFYIWAKGTVNEFGEKVEPNHWVSVYEKERNGSAWTLDLIRGEWYYHKFHKSQPDLNLRNEEVIEKLLETLDFWLEKGVDGFCFSAVSYYYEDKDLLDEFNFEEDDDGHEQESETENENENKNKNETNTTYENIELLYKFREHVDNWVEENNSTSKLLIAASDDPDEILISYYGNESHAGILPFNFRFITTINSSSNAQDIKNTIDEWVSLLPENATTNWVLTNHDSSRTPTRLSLGEMDVFQILTLLLPGQAFTYYGEEISMIDSQIPCNETIDPMGCKNSEDKFAYISRDPARTPMQWNSSTSAGFSTNEETFLPVNPSFEDNNVESQLADPYSNINIYKKVASLRKGNPVFSHGGYELKNLNENRVLVLKRFLEDYPTYIVVINLDASNDTLDLTSLYPELEDNFQVVISTDYDINTTEIEGSFSISGNEAVVLKGRGIANDSTTIFDEDEDSLSFTTVPDEESVTNEEENSSKENYENPIPAVEEETITSAVSAVHILQKDLIVMYFALFFIT